MWHNFFYYSGIVAWILVGIAAIFFSIVIAAACTIKDDGRGGYN